MAPYTIDEIRKIITPIAMRHCVERVSLFGSCSKGTASARSDVDLIIDKGKLNSLFQICRFRLDVEDALNLKADLVTTESSDTGFLDMIAKEEVLLHRNS